MIATDERVWVETLRVSLVGRFVDYGGCETYGGSTLARVRLDRDGRVWQVSRGQVRAS